MGRETKIIRLPIFDWLRWPSWIRSDPRSGFAEICGLAISGPFPSNEKASHLPMDTYGFQPLKITDDGGSSEVTSILSRRGDFGRVACCLRAAAGDPKQVYAGGPQAAGRNPHGKNNGATLRADRTMPTMGAQSKCQPEHKSGALSFCALGKRA